MTTSTPKVEMRLRKNKLVAGIDQTVEMLIRITPPEVPAAERPRLNFGIVLDRSGSMGGNKILHARDAARYCINELLPNDRVSMVIFDDKIDVLIKNQPVTNKQDLITRLDRITARGSTALHEGWIKGGMEVSGNLVADGINRVLLITDGLANVGITSVDEIVSQARGLNERGVSTSTIGIGSDFNEELLIPMAIGAGGNGWHVESSDDLRHIFEVELNCLIAQVASAVSMGVIPADGVRIVDVLNDFELNETGRYSLPNLQSGSALNVVVQLHVPAQPLGTKLRLADVKVGYTPQGAKSADTAKNFLEVEYASPQEVEGSPVDKEVASATELLMNARARKEAIQSLDKGDYLGAQEVLEHRGVRAMLGIKECLSDDAEFIVDTGQLRELEQKIADASQAAANRKDLRYRALYRSQGRKK